MLCEHATVPNRELEDATHLQRKDACCFPSALQWFEQCIWDLGFRRIRSLRLRYYEFYSHCMQPITTIFLHLSCFLSFFLSFFIYLFIFSFFSFLFSFLSAVLPYFFLSLFPLPLFLSFFLSFSLTIPLPASALSDYIFIYLSIHRSPLYLPKYKNYLSQYLKCNNIRDKPNSLLVLTNRWGVKLELVISLSEALRDDQAACFVLFLRAKYLYKKHLP